MQERIPRDEVTLAIGGFIEDSSAWKRVGAA
jgi:hypothetical protein